MSFPSYQQSNRTREREVLHLYQSSKSNGIDLPIAAEMEHSWIDESISLSVVVIFNKKKVSSDSRHMSDRSRKTKKMTSDSLRHTMKPTYY